MLVYSPISSTSSGSSALATSDDGYFDLVFANGSRRRIANPPDEVCRLVGGNNIFTPGIFEENKEDRKINCGGKVYHTFTLGKDESEGERKDELKLSDDITELPNQALRLHPSTLPTSYLAGRAVINDELGSTTIWPKELLGLLQEYYPEQCAQLTDSGRKCSQGSGYRFGRQTFDFPSTSAVVDCTQTCTREDCPVWINQLVSEFPSVITEYYIPRPLVEIKKEFKVIQMEITVTVSDLFRRKRSLKFVKQRIA